MAEDTPQQGVAEAVRRIGRAWLDGRVEDLASMVHPEMVMALPGFAGTVHGREAFVAGFRDFCQNARVHEFSEHDHRTDVVGDVAVATFRYDMVYERAGKKNRAEGRDLWVLRRQAGRWTAVWRTMLEMEEHIAQ